MNWFPAWQVIGLLPLTTSKSCSSKREITWIAHSLAVLLLALGWTVWKPLVFCCQKWGTSCDTNFREVCKTCPWPLPQERVAHAYLSLKNRVCQRSGYNNDSSSDSSDLVHSHGNSVKKNLDFFRSWMGSLEQKIRQNSELPNSEVLGVSCCLCMSSINLKQSNQASQAWHP